MTDEEMAEEYNKRNKCFREDVGKIQIEYKMYLNNLKQAYLDGFHEGQPKWHKVADGDLPRQDGHTCFSIKVLASNKKWVYYQFTNGKWFCGNKEVKVIAWCEIPQFKE